MYDLIVWPFVWLVDLAKSYDGAEPFLAMAVVLGLILMVIQIVRR